MHCRCRYTGQRVRRYGFHGTSHRFVAREAVSLLDLDPTDHGLVIAHLGNGASATAVQDGRSVDTTMGHDPAGRAGHGHPLWRHRRGGGAAHHAYGGPRSGRNGRAPQ